MNQDEESKPVSHFIFWSVIGVILVIIGYMFTEVAKVQSAQSVESASNNAVLVQLAQIQTDIQWIKDKLATQK